jgi:hypothetical protein
MQHLLFGDSEEHLTPALDRPKLMNHFVAKSTNGRIGRSCEVALPTVPVWLVPAAATNAATTSTVRTSVRSHFTLTSRTH